MYAALTADTAVVDSGQLRGLFDDSASERTGLPEEHIIKCLGRCHVAQIDIKGFVTAQRIAYQKSQLRLSCSA
jgi:hypothetical protein